MVGGYSSQGWMVGGTPARSGWLGVPQPGLDGGGYPGQIWMVGGLPQPGLDGWGYPGYPPT